MCDLDPSFKQILCGRIVAKTETEAWIQNEQGTRQARVRSTESIQIGDIVRVREDRIEILTPNRTPSRSMKWLQRTLDPRRIQATRLRHKIETGIREFFLSREFIETRTPLLVPCPGMETHIRPFQVKSTREPAYQAYLPTSPEFAMKRLLVGGLERIFQMSHAFRDEPNSPHHHPEFTLLEWYRAYAGYEAIMKDTEELLEFLAIKLHGKPSFIFDGQEISVKTPWPRLRVRDLFAEWVGVDLVLKKDRGSLAEECLRLGLPVNSEDHWDDLYFKIWLNLIEPKLPKDYAVFVMRYPPSQAALSVIDEDPDGSRWARRFELYAGGIELGNAFEELTDPVEQRKRFIEDMNLREQIYGPSFPKNPLDEEFLDALSEGMPPSGGIAIGVDRIVMLLANEPHIDYTTWL